MWKPKLSQSTQETTSSQHYQFILTDQRKELTLFCLWVHGKKCVLTVEGRAEAQWNKD